MEYAALVDIKCSKSGQFSSDSEKMRHEREWQTRNIFRFHPNHSLYESHHQVLRAKQHTLIFNANPPAFPGLPPILPNAQGTQQEIDEFHADHKFWTNTTQKFANFFEICFLPYEHLHGDLQPTVPITWETFCEKIAKMETSNLLIDKLKLDAMFTFIYGFCSNNKKKTLFSNYWHQNTTQWSTNAKKQRKFLQLWGPETKDSLMRMLLRIWSMVNSHKNFFTWQNKSIQGRHQLLQIPDGIN